VHYRYSGFRLFGRVQEAKGIASKRVDYRMHVYPTDALNMPLSEAWIQLLDVGYLVGGKLKAIFRRFLLQGEPAIIPGTKAVLNQDLLNGDIGDIRPFQGQELLNLVASV